METVFEDIALRTGGNIYIGVVGPVRTGKSTLVKRIMEKLVIPCIEDPYRKERARDELPQSGSGKTITTSEPKFVPEEAVEISPDEKTLLRVRMIDSVGYMVDGALGAEEDGQVRMVTTPWYDYELPMTQAAELGTKKVMEEHASIGMVVTTDGTVTDLPREAYIPAEKRAISDMVATGKPFLIIVNTRDPKGEQAKRAAQQIEEEFSRKAFICDCQTLDAERIGELFCALLESFPMQALHVHLPRWLDALENEHPVKSLLYHALVEKAEQITSLAQAQTILPELGTMEQVTEFSLRETDLGTGTVVCALALPQTLYYEILSAQTGITIRSDAELLAILIDLARVKREYDKISDALSAVKATGYGVVMPSAEEMTLETPEILRKGGAYGVKLKAGAPSIHMMRVDVDTEISPMVGDEQQSQALVSSLTQADPEKLWESHIFGKSVYELLQEGLTTKLVRLPEDVRGKFRGTLTKIVNEGATGLICLIL